MLALERWKHLASLPRSLHGALARPAQIQIPAEEPCNISGLRPRSARWVQLTSIKPLRCRFARLELERVSAHGIRN